MTTFIDPRSRPNPATATTPARTTKQVDSLAELHQLCREGRLYDVEVWIQEGRPSQLAEKADVGRRRVSSALEIALGRQDHALALLLLCNGYDPNLERRSPLNLALRARRWDLVDLLLGWGADPHQVELTDLFDTYNSKLFERFRVLGIDLTAGHELADALGFHSSNKPLFGFARRHRRHDPKFQRELDIALAYHASEGSERGVALCLWAGADPHAAVPDLRYLGRYEEDDQQSEDEEDRFVGFTAIEQACRRGDVKILERLGPDPALDDFDELYKAASSRAVIDFLARFTLPQDGAAVIRYHLWWATFDRGFRFSTGRSLYTLQHLFELGVRWEDSSKEEIASVRSGLLKTSKHTFVDAMKLLATRDYCAPETLRELGRTPAIRRRMKEVGFIPTSEDEASRFRRSRQPPPTRSREVLKKFGVEAKEPKRSVAARSDSRPDSRRTARSLPHTVRIGPRRRDGREIRLDRAALFECVWSEPVSTLADKWGLSDRGLAKACRRLNVPVPGRGHWAKIQAGKRVRRPALPKLPEGEADEIVVWAPV
jgi:hypothetical protein